MTFTGAKPALKSNEGMKTASIWESTTGGVSPFHELQGAIDEHLSVIIRKWNAAVMRKVVESRS